MRRRQIYAERYPAMVQEAKAAIIARAVESTATADELIAALAGTCERCGKSGLKNVGAHRRFCKG